MIQQESRWISKGQLGTIFGATQFTLRNLESVNLHVYYHCIKATDPNH